MLAYSCSIAQEPGTCSEHGGDVEICEDGNNGCFLRRQTDNSKTSDVYNSCADYEESAMGCHLASQTSKCAEDYVNLCNWDLSARAHAVLVTLLLVLGMVAVNMHAFRFSGVVLRPPSPRYWRTCLYLRLFLLLKSVFCYVFLKLVDHVMFHLSLVDISSSVPDRLEVKSVVYEMIDRQTDGRTHGQSNADLPVSCTH